MQHPKLMTQSDVSPTEELFGVFKELPLGKFVLRDAL
jgi:hypothetical protein